MAKYEIKQWEEIKDHYKDAIILGNGASIAISNKFMYDSLYDLLKKMKIWSKTYVPKYKFTDR